MEIAAWTVAAVTGAAILITGTVLTVRVVRRVRARRALRQAAYHVAPVIPAARLIEHPAIDRPPGVPRSASPRSTGPGRGRCPGGGRTSAPGSAVTVMSTAPGNPANPPAAGPCTAATQFTAPALPQRRHPP